MQLSTKMSNISNLGVIRMQNVSTILGFSNDDPSTFASAFQISYAVISFLSFWNNALLCVVMLRKRKMLSIPYNVLIFVLALTDLTTGIAIVLTPQFVVKMQSFPIPCGLGGEVFCRLFRSRYIIFVFGKGSVLNVMCLSIERWYAMVRPIQYKTKFSNTRLYRYIAGIWVTAFTLQSYKLFQFRGSGCTCVQEVDLIEKSLVKVMGVAYTTTTLFVPTAIMWLAFAHIWYSIRKSPLALATRRGKAKKRLLAMCAATAFMLTVNWYPIEIVYILSQFNGATAPEHATKIAGVLAMSNSMINPVVYCLTNSHYRREFAALFWSICKARSLSRNVYELSGGARVNQELYLGNARGGAKINETFSMSTGV